MSLSTRLRPIKLALLAVSVFTSSCVFSDPIVIKHVDIFDGKNASLKKDMSVVIDGDQITSIGSTLVDIPADAYVIDGKGKVLMPGLIDAHWHSLMAPNSMKDLASANTGYLHIMAGAEANEVLMRGFTTVRDLGSPSFGLKRAIDEGSIPGPRIYPSGAGISQTSGHGDVRPRASHPKRFGTASRWEELGLMAVADGESEVLTLVREQLRLGASQIKVMGGGGAGSEFDPLDSIQYTPSEMRAAVNAAANWGTYVTTHTYTPDAIRQAVEAGVKCIEHGHLIDEPTMELLADKGVWLSMQPFTGKKADDPTRTAAQKKKSAMVATGTDNAYRLAKKHGVKLAFGTDLLFSQKATATQNHQLTKLLTWFAPAEILIMATSTNGELMALSGPRNPYPKKLGVVEEGAYADLLLVDGNPLEDFSLMENAADSFDVIIKNGEIIKNQL